MTNNRSSQRSAGRLSNTLRRGDKGDPRDHRREQKRLTEQDIDPEFFVVKDGKLSLKSSSPSSTSIAENLGSSLELDPQGRARVKPGSRVNDAETGAPTAALNAASINSILLSLRNAGLLEQ